MDEGNGTSDDADAIGGRNHNYNKTSDEIADNEGNGIDKDKTDDACDDRTDDQPKMTVMNELMIRPTMKATNGLMMRQTMTVSDGIMMKSTMTVPDGILMGK